MVVSLPSTRLRVMVRLQRDRERGIMRWISHSKMILHLPLPCRYNKPFHPRHPRPSTLVLCCDVSSHSLHL